ncbi:MAG: tRNA guanosine(34) transglycosylase Tgt [Planctomycetota bacterium]
MTESNAFRFELFETDPSCAARRGRFHTPHGSLETPAFMPVGTRATVKGLTPDQLRSIGVEMVLANTYHLHLRPGEEVVRELGGLHRFMGWEGPILTDSGGYQVFSLRHLTKVDERGATLTSVVDGDPVHLTPESVMQIERDLGADVIMALDHCPSDPTDRAEVERATDRTHRWLRRCVEAFESTPPPHGPQALFPIVQGGAFKDLRERAVAETLELYDARGFAIGGVSVGEDREAMRLAVRSAAPLLPADRPRYLMGVGTPEDFLVAISEGVDLFDCVTPTRHGRNHQAYVPEGRINLRNQRWARDDRPIDEHCDCPTCARFSRGYLRHLCTTGEMLAGVLLSMHNVRVFERLMERVRVAISEGRFAQLVEELRAPAG